MNKFSGEYSEDWDQVARAVKAAHGWKCERCGHPHDPSAGYTLTVHHLDGDKSNNVDWNLACLCQRCHLEIQGRVFFPQSYMFDHSPWMKPHVEGYKKHLIERGILHDQEEEQAPGVLRKGYGHQ